MTVMSLQEVRDRRKALLSIQIVKDEHNEYPGLHTNWIGEPGLGEPARWQGFVFLSTC